MDGEKINLRGSIYEEKTIIYNGGINAR